jgi:hypothetical protein
LSFAVVCSDGIQSGVPPLKGTAALASTVKNTSPIAGVEYVNPDAWIARRNHKRVPCAICRRGRSGERRLNVGIDGAVGFGAHLIPVLAALFRYPDFSQQLTVSFNLTFVAHLSMNLMERRISTLRMAKVRGSDLFYHRGRIVRVFWRTTLPNLDRTMTARK